VDGVEGTFTRWKSDTIEGGGKLQNQTLKEFFVGFAFVSSTHFVVGMMLDLVGQMS
jgi:hypothetical protein